MRVPQAWRNWLSRNLEPKAASAVEKRFLWILWRNGIPRSLVASFSLWLGAEHLDSGLSFDGFGKFAKSYEMV